MVAKTDFVHMAFPPTFVHPYTATDKNGKTWDKAIITMPRNTFLNNRDIAYYNLDVFMNDHMSEQKQQGKNVIVNVREDQPLELFKGKGELRQTILIEDPWKLAKAIKHARETYTDKDKTEGGVQDMLTVTVTSPHIHGYEQPVTLPLNQADYELTRLDDLISDVRFCYPADTRENIVTCIITSDEQEYSEQLYLGDGYRGMTELMNSEYADSTNESLHSLIHQMGNKTTIPLTKQQLEESQARIEHAATQLTKDFQQEAESLGDESYLGEVHARTHIDYEALHVAQNILNNVLERAVVKVSRESTSLREAYSLAQETAENLTPPTLQAYENLNNVTRTIYRGRIITHVANRVYMQAELRIRARLHPSLRRQKKTQTVANSEKNEHSHRRFTHHK